MGLINIIQTVELCYDQTDAQKNEKTCSQRQRYCIPVLGFLFFVFFVLGFKFSPYVSEVHSVPFIKSNASG